MFKKYKLKYCLTLTITLIISSIILRVGAFEEVELLSFLNYFIRLSTTIVACWLIHGYFLLHKFSCLSNYVKHFVSNILAILSCLVLTYIYIGLMPVNNLIEEVDYGKPFTAFMHEFTRAFFLSIICYTVIYSLIANAALQNSKLQNEVLEQAHLRAQLISLQQQISPHFLFNSLSTLKTIATDQPTKNYIVQLSSVYRYVLNFNEHYLTPLKDEICFIRSYLYIMNERFEDALQVDINISEEYLKLLIPPLSLQLLIENAIKHNRISPDSPLHISIFSENSSALTVKNNFQPKKILEEGTGTGLKNIAERYKLLINEGIHIFKDAEEFSVTIPLIKK